MVDSLPTKTNEGKEIIYYQRDTKDAYGVTIVNPQTGGRSSLNAIDFSRWVQYAGGKLKDWKRAGQFNQNVEFRQLPDTKIVAESRRRSSEREYEKDIASKKAGYADYQDFKEQTGTTANSLRDIQPQQQGQPPIEIGGKIYTVYTKEFIEKKLEEQARKERIEEQQAQLALEKKNPAIIASKLAVAESDLIKGSDKFKRLAQKRREEIQRENPEITTARDITYSVAGGQGKLTVSVPEVRPTPQQEFREEKVNDIPVLTPTDQARTQEFLAGKEIQQTVSSKSDLPDLSLIAPKKPGGVMNIDTGVPFGKKLISNKKDYIQYEFKASLQGEKNPLRITQKVVGFLPEIGRETKNKFGAVLLVGGGSFLKTAYEISPVGVGLSLKDRGFLGTLEAYNPANVITAIKENKLLRSQDPLLRGAELTGIAGGIYAGSKVSEATLDLSKKGVEKVREVNYNRNLRKWEQSLPKEPTTFRDTTYLDVFPEKLQKAPEGSFKVKIEPGRGKASIEPIKEGFNVLERDTGAILKEKQTQLKPKDVDLYEGLIPEKLSKEKIEPPQSNLRQTTDLDTVLDLETIEFSPKKVTESGARISDLPPEIRGKQTQLREKAVIEKEIFSKTESGKDILTDIEKTEIEFSRFGKEVDFSKSSLYKDFKVKKKIRGKITDSILYSDVTGLFTVTKLTSESLFKGFDSIRSNLKLADPFKLNLGEGQISTGVGRGLILPPDFGDFMDTGSDIDLGKKRKTGRDVGPDIGREPDKRRDLFRIPLGELKTELGLEKDYFRDYEPSIIRSPKRSPINDLARDSKIDTRQDLIIPPLLDLSITDDLDFTGSGRTTKTPKTPEKKTPALAKFPDLDLNLRKEEIELYNVKARERGVWVKVNKDPLPRNQALNLGGEVVDNTASASFRLEKAREKGKDVLDNPFFNFGQKFTKKGDIYTEKNKNRIDTVGELQGITVKGWLANRLKGGLGL